MKHLVYLCCIFISLGCYPSKEYFDSQKQSIETLKKQSVETNTIVNQINSKIENPENQTKIFTKRLNGYLVSKPNSSQGKGTGIIRIENLNNSTNNKDFHWAIIYNSNLLPNFNTIEIFEDVNVLVEIINGVTIAKEITIGHVQSSELMSIEKFDFFVKNGCINLHDLEFHSNTGSHYLGHIDYEKTGTTKNKVLFEGQDYYQINWEKDTLNYLTIQSDLTSGIDVYFVKKIRNVTIGNINYIIAEFINHTNYKHVGER